MLRFAQRAVVFIFLFSALLEAQPPDLLTRGPAYADALARFAGTDGVGKDGPMSKLGFTLTLLYSEYRLFVETGVTGSFVPTDPLFSQLGLQDRVVVDMVASGDVGKFVDELRTMGFEHVTAFRHVVSALAPIEKLETLASLPALRMARAGLAKSRAGSVTSQGDPAMESDLLRPVLDGSGVTVGTLSDSYDCLAGAAGDVASGDLPTGVVVLDDSACPGSDEGRAMMQLIHDVAPGSTQAFHTAFLGQADFASGIVELATMAGADVIVDDIIYFFEPMFQDGIIAQAADTVHGMGVPFFSAAGNDGRDAQEEPYRAGIDPVFGLAAHDFDPGAGTDFYQSITIPVGGTLTIAFQWDEPYASATGGGGSSNDVDIYLLDEPPSGVFASGVDFNMGADPSEVFSFTNTGGLPTAGGDTFNLYINLFSGPTPTYLKYVLFSFPGTVNEHFTASGSLYGHVNAAGAVAVGAAGYFDTPDFGTDPPLLEPYSSAGPMPILFDLSDSPIMEVRPKPEIVGPDGGDNTFFGSDFEPNGFPNFFGTSAAAPHVAALAALLLELAPGSTPDEVLAALEGSAIDMGPAGFDDDSGFGLVNAVGAANLISPPLAGPPAPPAPDPVPPGRPTSPDPPVSSPDAEKNRVGQSYVRPVERKP